MMKLIHARVPQRAVLAGLILVCAAGRVAGQDDCTRRTLAISGYVSASYTYSNANTENLIVGRFYDRLHDQVVVNAAKVVFDLVPAIRKLDAGFRADFLFGQNAAVTKSLGLNLSDNADSIQGYAVLNVPLRGEGKYVQFRIGKMANPDGPRGDRGCVEPEPVSRQPICFPGELDQHRAPRGREAERNA
jgi:hypothetical protein